MMMMMMMMTMEANRRSDISLHHRLLLTPVGPDGLAGVVRRVASESER